MLYLARISVCYSKLPCVQIALPFMSVSYQNDILSTQNCGHCYVFLTEIDSVSSTVYVPWASESENWKWEKMVIPHLLFKEEGI